MSAAGVLLSTIDASIVNIALPTISDIFKTSVQTTAWVSISYLLVITALLLIFGRLSDVYGQKLIFMSGLIIFTLGSALCAISGTITELIFFRAIQGVGAAMIVSNTSAIVTNAFPPEQRGTGLGVIGAVVSVGLMAGPPLGGLLIHYWGWNYIFLVNVPIGIAAIILTLKVLPEHKAHLGAKAFHPLDSILWMLGIIAFVSVFGIAGQENPIVIAIAGSATLSLIFLAVFYRRQIKSNSPLLNPYFFKNDIFMFASVAGLFANMAMIGLVFMLPFFMENTLHMTPLQTGYILITIPATTAFASPISGFLSDKLGQRLIASLGVIISTTGVCLMLLLRENSSSLHMILNLAIFGLGVGMFGTPNNSALMGSVDIKDRGSAGGVLATIRNLGMVSGLGIMSVIFNYGIHKSADADVIKYARAFNSSLPVVIGISIIALVFSAIRKSVK